MSKLPGIDHDDADGAAAAAGSADVDVFIDCEGSEVGIASVAPPPPQAQIAKLSDGINDEIHDKQSTTLRAPTPIGKQSKDVGSTSGDGGNDGGYDGRVNEAFPDEGCIIDKVILSQILNRVRTTLLHTLTVEQRLAPISADFVREHCGMSEETPHEETQKFERILSCIRFHELQTARVTVLDIVVFDSDGVPFVAPETLDGLALLARQVVVGKDQVKEILEGDGIIGSDHQAVEDTLESIFPFETRVLPGTLLADYLEKAQRPVSKVRFSTSFVKDVVHSMRSLATSIPYLALIVVFFAMVGQLDLWSRFASYLNASTPEEPWRNECHGGVVNGSCYMHRRDIEEAVSQIETIQFVRREVVRDLWKYASPTQGAADVQFEGSWLIGALIFRTSPPVGTTAAPDAPLHPCAKLNLSEHVLEPRIGHLFDCMYWNATVIPFADTLEEALHHSEHYDLAVPQFVDASLIIQYAMYAPSTGNIAWVTTALSIPKFGGIVPRIQIKVMDTTMHGMIAMAFWFSLGIWVLDAVALGILWNLKVGFWHAVGSFLFRSFLLGLISASYYFVVDIHIDGLLTTHHVIPGLDHAVNSSLQAEQLFAVWALFLLVLFLQFIAYLDGFKIIVTLVVRIVPEIVGLFFVFGFLYVMFVMIALVLFGQTCEEYSSFFNANVQLIQYFLLKFDLALLMENYPQSGFAFYYVYRIFLFYLVLNFFIVTVIAPIRSVWLQGDLPIAVNNMIDALHSHTILGRLSSHLHRYGIMCLDLVVGFVPITLPYWIRCYYCLEDLYDPMSELGDFLNACQTLLDKRTADATRYETERARTLPVLKLAHFDASHNISLLLIVSETNFRGIRDARTMRLLAAFDEFNTSLEKELHPPEDEGETVLPPQPLPLRRGSTPPSSSVRRTSRQEDDRLRAKAVGMTTVHGFATGAPEAVAEEDFEENTVELGDVHDGDVKFHFTRYLVQEIRDHRFFHDTFYVLFCLLDRAAIVGIYIAMLVLVNGTPRSMSYFSRNAHSGIRDLPYHQNCFDENCTSGFTKHWTYQDNKRLDHLRMFVDRRLSLSLYRDDAHGHGEHEDVPNLTGLHDAVAWDSYISLHGPLYVRQLRAVDVPCIVPKGGHDSDPVEDHHRQAQMNAHACGSSNQFTTEALHRDADSKLEEGAYHHQDTCPEIDKLPVYGVHFRQIPCKGYIAAVHNKSQLEYAVNHWIDGQTRFVGISLVLVHGRDSRSAEEALELQYNLYAEFSEGGSAGQFFTRTSPVADPDLDSVNDVGVVLMSINAAFGVLELVVPMLHCVYHRRWATLLQQSVWSARLVWYAAFLATYLISLDDHSNAWPRLSAATIMIVWITYQTLFHVVFPFSQFFLRRVTIVNHFIRLTVVKVALLIPVFAIILSAFAVAGYLLWAGRLQEFSTMHRSFYTTSQGLLGDFAFAEMYMINATYAVIYMVLFLVLVIIFLLNLLLAIVAGCAEESREESQVVAPIEVIGRVMRRRVYFGPIVGVLMMFLIDDDGGQPARTQQQQQSSSSSAACADEKGVPSPLLGTESEATEQVPNPLSPSSPIKGGPGRDVDAFLPPVRKSVSLATDSVVVPQDGRPTTTTAAAGRLSISAMAPPLRRESVVYGVTDAQLASSRGNWSSIVAFLFELRRRGGRRETPRLHVVEHERIPTPLECLLPRLGPVLLSEVVHVLHLTHRPEAMRCSFVAYILAMHQAFQVAHPGLFAEDLVRDEDRQIQTLGAFHILQEKRKHNGAHTPMGDVVAPKKPSEAVRVTKERAADAVRRAAKKGKGRLDAFDRLGASGQDWASFSLGRSNSFSSKGKDAARQ